jgi:hypothetical protein
MAGESGAGHVVSALVEKHDDGALGNEIGMAINLQMRRSALSAQLSRISMTSKPVCRRCGSGRAHGSARKLALGSL